jgi:hypothetical protein
VPTLAVPLDGYDVLPGHEKGRQAHLFRPRTGARRSLSQAPDSIVAMKKLILLAVLVGLGAVAAKKVKAS